VVPLSTLAAILAAAALGAADPGSLPGASGSAGTVLRAFAGTAAPPVTAGTSTPAAQEAGATLRRSLSLLGGWGHSWRPGLPGWGQTRSDVSFGALHPQLGWFLTERLEMYGEATLLVYGRPETAVSGGLAPIALRYHLRDEGTWRPYLTLGAGALWTSLDVVEIDRTFNFQVLYGVGLRQIPDSGPGWMVEFRNHHISNAGTEPPNIGLNAGVVIGGLTWVVR